MENGTLMTDIPPHKHCPVCGISIPPDQQFCSKKCEEQWNAMMRQKKRSIYLMWIMVAVLVVIMLISVRL